MTELKAIIKNSDMNPEMQEAIVHIAANAFGQDNLEKDIASIIKKEADAKYSPNWHCIVGKHFGSYVTHETHNFIYFYLNERAVLLFKAG